MRGVNRSESTAETEVGGSPGSVLAVGVPEVSATGRRAARFSATLLQIVGGCAVLALSAQVRVPFPGTDVPGTLQLLAVLLLGLGLCRTVAVGSVALYLLCGGLGLGVFAPGSAGLLGPTGGYLVGFGAAALLMARLRGYRVSPVWRLWLVGLAGAGVVLAFGVGGRWLWLEDWTWAVATGLVPFVAKASIEVTLAVALVSMGRSAGGRFAD